MGRRSRGPGRVAPAEADPQPTPRLPGAAATAATARKTGQGPRRLVALDFFRGCALVAMVVYHFCFDLVWMGWLAADFNANPGWIGFRSSILGSFLFIAGASLGLAEARGQSPARFWRRVGTIAGAAALVSLGSYVMFPQSFIYFGVLHAIALSSVLARPALKLGGWIALPGIAVLVVGAAVTHPFFDQPALHWVGLMTFKPRTEDYVPLFPWFGMVLLGAGAGAWVEGRPDWLASLAAWRVPGRLGWMAWLGRHSLAAYLLHQPLLLASMLLIRQFH